jgi:hypothetical protein
MKVRATKRGYYGAILREPGEVFELRRDADFSKNWMVVEAAKPAAPGGDVKPGGDAKPGKPKSPGKPTDASAPADFNGTI